MSEQNKQASTPEEWMKKVERLASEVCQREGCIFYDMEFGGLGNGRTLRIYVDKEGGVGIEDCSNVSKGLNLMLDVEDVVPGGHYNLEVSTPGIDRHLRKPWHFEKAVGKKVWVKSRLAMEELGVTDKKWLKAKQVEEMVTAADDEAVTFGTKEGPIRIPYGVIEKAKIVFEMKQPSKKK